MPSASADGMIKEPTQELSLITGVAVAFARSPLTLAHLAYDLQLTSKGRFIMGLGSQVKAHIERRYNSRGPGPQRGCVIWSMPSTLFGTAGRVIPPESNRSEK